MEARRNGARYLCMPLKRGEKQIWALVSGQDGTQFSSCWQTSTDPTVPWSDWQAFDGPSPATGGPSDGLQTALQLCSGRTQMWLISLDGTLLSINKISSDASSDWTAWEPFLPNPGFVRTVAVGTHKDGKCQIWVLTGFDADGLAHILTCRQTCRIGRTGKASVPSVSPNS